MPDPAGEERPSENGASTHRLRQNYRRKISAVQFRTLPLSAGTITGRLSSGGANELGHLEMVGTLVHQLTRNLTQEQIIASGFAPYFVDHTTGVYPTAASGSPWSADSIQSTGDVIADLTEDMAADGAIA